MGEKSIQKKKYILEKAREVFTEKGFQRVTMKDIVEACDISRGGLYLYFESTDQIFLEVLRGEGSEPDDIFSTVTEDATAADILLIFLQEQKKEILRKKDSLTSAAYEYYFANKPKGKDNVLKKRFDSSVRIITKLLEIGVENGEFYCEDPEDAAKNILYLIEGLKVTAQTIGVSGDAIDKQILYILTSLGVGEDEE